MKPTTLLSSCLLVSNASAYGIRGAAERALYYLVYMMEDVHFTKEPSDGLDGWKIAPDCVGTRKGLWGQKGRCNLAEFLDHTWAPTDWQNEKAGTSGVDDKRPGAANGPLKFGKTMAGVTDTQGIVSMIMSVTDKNKNVIANDIVVYEKDENGKDKIVNGKKVEKSRTVQYGYTGKVDRTKFFPGENLDYFTTLDKFGPRAVQLKADLDAAIEKGQIHPDPTDPKYNKAHKAAVDKLNKLFSETKVAANAIVQFRVQDRWRHIQSMGKFKDNLGVDAVFEKPKDRPLTWIGEWEEISKDKTVDRMVEELKISKDEAIKRYDSYWSKLTSTDSYKAHSAAIDGAKGTLAALDAPSCK